ncbi:unnamed protein product [Malus baccata var. baccata]
MSGPSDRRFDLNLGEGVAPPSPDNIWRLSFISLTGPLTVGDSVIKNDMTAAVVARNLVTPRDNRLLSRRLIGAYLCALVLRPKDARRCILEHFGAKWSLECMSHIWSQGLETKYAKKCKMEHFRAKLSWNGVYANGAQGMDEFEGQRSLRNEEMKESLALSVQCAGSVSNMAQRLFARTRQVESLAAEVMSLKEEIKGLKHENKQLHKLAHNYATNMKRKIDQMQESDGQILLDHRRFVGLFQ